eukprot:7883271-Pyramimonas_sp.AAC.1
MRGRDVFRDVKRKAERAVVARVRAWRLRAKPWSWMSPARDTNRGVVRASDCCRVSTSRGTAHGRFAIGFPLPRASMKQFNNELFGLWSQGDCLKSNLKCLH